MHDSVASKASKAERECAGSRALSVFARVLTARILRAHAEGALTARDLEARLGWAAKASLRVAVSNLCDLGALMRSRPGSDRPAVTELTEAGRQLLTVADVLERWLSHSPFGKVELPDPAARGTIRALVAGWDSTIVRALAERPCSLATLSEEIGHHSYAALKRRLAGMRAVDLVAPVNGRTRSPAHEATHWLRCAVGPLSVAGRWERNHARGNAPSMTRQEIEAALLLALPLVELPREATGQCVLAALAADASKQAESSLAAVSVVVEGGKLTHCTSGAEKTPTTWALGTPDAWLDAIIDGDCEALRLRGSTPDLVTTLVGGLHKGLFESYSTDS